VPLESGLVSRMIEQAQTRVEGSNFDVRKHLLEYDDVLNQQRARVYEMRERIFEKEEIDDDIREMLAVEIERHIQLAEKDEEGPWRLFAWLDQIQPPQRLGTGEVLPSFTVKVVVDELLAAPESSRRDQLLELAGRAMDEEADHLAAALDRQVGQIEQHTEQAKRENREAVETALEGAELEAREQQTAISPRAMVDAAAAVAPIAKDGIPRELLTPERSYELKKHLLSLAEDAAWARAAAQASAWLQRRTGLAHVRAQLEKALAERRKRVLKEVEEQIRAVSSEVLEERTLAGLLAAVTMRTQTVFDRDTHQRRAIASARFSWVYLAAQLAAGEADRRSGRLAEVVQDHLDTALESLRGEWGRTLLTRYGEETLPSLPPDFQSAIREVFLGGESGTALDEVSLKDWPEKTRRIVAPVIGGRVLTRAHRELMLGMIGQSWVEYLTNMEALRTSIGLEAYAQRDPLVTYKSRAVDLFQDLMRQVRAGVISRIYLMNLRAAPASAPAGAPAASAAEEPSAPRRKRHRH
jgi:preprotein translocase subunit SecA